MNIKMENSFDKVLCKSWQSFSTMKNFITEADRLENASWRLWFMEKMGKVNGKSKNAEIEKKYCVYCQVQVGVMSCDGCCHDVYCVKCFQLVHKRGHLASHIGHFRTVESNSVKAKHWEVEMDTVIQNMMSNRIPREGDVSVHTINTSSRVEKNVVCAHCQGGHMTYECPELENEQFDVTLRKTFTTIHNDNRSNSTHAYLGDEISVHGGVKHAFAPNVYSGNIAFDGKSFLGDEGSQRRGKRGGVFSAEMFTENHTPIHVKNDENGIFTGITCIQEEQNCKICGKIPKQLPCFCLGEVDEMDTMAVLPPVVKVIPGMPRQPDQWILASLAGEADGTVIQNSYEADNVQGVVQLKNVSSIWRYRYVVLYRNILYEYLSEKHYRQSESPIGHCNLSGSRIRDVNGHYILECTYYITSTLVNGTTKKFIRLSQETELKQWYEALCNAAALRIDMLFDLSPPNGGNSLELGKGRFSVVRKAMRKSNNRHCALKIIDKNAFWSLVQGETERDDTIFREVYTQSVLSLKIEAEYSPIVQLLSIFETMDMLVLELELMHGGDLFDLLGSAGSVHETYAATLAAELIYAISFCRKHGVAHRDIKLSNLALLRPFDFTIHPSEQSHPCGSLKLADFGMASMIDSHGMLRGRCGTPGYVAPEILTAKVREPYQSGVDMFSAGVVLYTLLCGYEPFYGVTDKELVAANKSARFEFHNPEWTTISSDAKDLVTRMMCPDPMARITPERALQHPFIYNTARERNFV